MSVWRSLNKPNIISRGKIIEHKIPSVLQLTYMINLLLESVCYGTKVGVIYLCGGLVFLHQAINGIPSHIQLSQIILEHRLTSELIEEGVTLLQLIVLGQSTIEECTDARIIAHHQAGDLVGRLHVGWTARESDLNAGRAPGYELGELTLSYTLQWLVHLCGIHLALDYIQYGYVAVPLVRWRGDHHVLGLQQTTHYIQHGSLAHIDLGLRGRRNEAKDYVLYKIRCLPRDLWLGACSQSWGSAIVAWVSKAPSVQSDCYSYTKDIAMWSWTHSLWWTPDCWSAWRWASVCVDVRWQCDSVPCYPAQQHSRHT